MKLLHWFRGDDSYPFRDTKPTLERVPWPDERLRAAIKVAMNDKALGHEKRLRAALRELTIREIQSYGPDKPKGGELRIRCFCCWSDWLPGEPERHAKMLPGKNLAIKADGELCPCAEKLP